VPGCKTDVNDATRLAEPLAHGLLRVSFVPDLQTQEMRTLLRSRKQLVREQSSHVLRVQRTLEDGNIKLGSNQSCQTEQPCSSAGLVLARGAVRGPSWPSYRAPSFPAANISIPSTPPWRRPMRRWKKPRALRTVVELPMSTPGIKNLNAQVAVSEIEIGIDMSRFPSTTRSRTARYTRTSVAITSIAAPLTSKKSASSSACLILANEVELSPLAA
jgi:hypothetical protein